MSERDFDDALYVVEDNLGKLSELFYLKTGVETTFNVKVSNNLISVWSDPIEDGLSDLDKLMFSEVQIDLGSDVVDFADNKIVFTNPTIAYTTKVGVNSYIELKFMIVFNLETETWKFVE